MTLQAVSAKVGIRLPWEKVAEAMGPIYTEGSIVQHLSKLRTKRSNLGLPVPQSWGRGSGSGKANVTMASSANVSGNDEDGTGDDSEDDSSHRTVKRRAPKRAPANSKKASAQDGTLTTPGKRKVDVVDDSDVKCAGAPFLEVGHGKLTHLLSPSNSENDEDADCLPGSRKRKEVSFHSASTNVTRFKVKKSALAKLQLRQAQKEENALMPPPSKREKAIDDSMDGAYSDYPEVPSPWLESPLHMGHPRVAGPMDFNDAADPNAQSIRNPRVDNLSRKALPELYSQGSLRHNPSNHAGSLISGHDQSYLNQYGAIRNLYNISAHAAAGSGNSKSPWDSRMPPTPAGSSPPVPDVSYGYAALDLILQQQAHHGAIDPRILGELDPTMPSERTTDEPPLDDTINDMFVVQDSLNEEPYPRVKRERNE